MAFMDYTFDSPGGRRRLAALSRPREVAIPARFAEAFSVHQLIRFDTRVVEVCDSACWQVTTGHSGRHSTASFERWRCERAYHKPRIPAIPGLSDFPGGLLHSHNYRQPEVTREKNFPARGASSAADISQEIAGVAEHVYLCADLSKQHGIGFPEKPNIERRPTVSQLYEMVGFASPRYDQWARGSLCLCNRLPLFVPLSCQRAHQVSDNHVTSLTTTYCA
ncbi:MAG: hypothetical protein Ct9H300mP16_16240 [Pseudomonadota bacterium]|nr:MAG: hypothetical protein Ct9H300mP16_16240 [Pseudomonadota bacterium]